ncbi:zinc finger domain-containing [Pyrenophora seminiperda CCB06]|uniref:Zinc finger domain-containing n=1 Tax=Pyrenophora seminiperda CCB06 TaxID=1302712 RepID=A0A3M7MCD4_9PLEO|nr:zinc finger domain-containing [Pyrenophora seminiperda CCB06]
MAEYAQYPASMPQDFELYSNAHEHHMDFHHNQPFLSSYGMEHAFSASYDPMAPLTDLQRPQDLQYHYDAIAQGVRPYQYHTPAGSPHSISHSFHEMPPVLEASSESGASVSSSAMGSPTIIPQFNDSWNPMTLGATPGYDYSTMTAEKSYVGKSIVPSTTTSSFPFTKSPMSPNRQRHVFKTPTTPASATRPSTRSSERPNSPLSNQVHTGRVQRVTSLTSTSAPPPFQSSRYCRFPLEPKTTDTNPMQVDPNLIQPFSFAPPSPYPEIRTTPSPYFPVIEQPPSPALSNISSYSQRPGSARVKKGSISPYLHTQRYQPYPQNQRRSSVNSLQSQHSGTSRKSGSSYDVEDETREKGMCRLPECGRVFKDLKAHMLTHQNERPEKCPIATCEYHIKGFARKYDKNRHTLTHYKGTMVCGFCPGSGSAAEKSFNRADVFKRHLTTVHGVEQNPPNSRKRSPSNRKVLGNAQPNVAGTCSTCSVTFANAQEFYEHLDDCVLRVVQQTDPSEAINQRLLTSVAEDKDVTETLDRNGLSKSIEYNVPSYDEDEEEEFEEEEIDNDDQGDATYGSRRARSGKGGIKSTNVGPTQHVGGGNNANQQQHYSSSRVTKSGVRTGLTFSKGGVAIVSSGRKKRKNYPASWGCAVDKMKMKKRVLCVYDGQRRLCKDDLMLDQEYEVRMKMPDGKSYVTDLDMQTMKRSEAMHDATVEEKGPLMPERVACAVTAQVSNVNWFGI